MKNNINIGLYIIMRSEKMQCNDVNNIKKDKKNNRFFFICVCFVCTSFSFIYLAAVFVVTVHCFSFYCLLLNYYGRVIWTSKYRYNMWRCVFDKIHIVIFTKLWLLIVVTNLLWDIKHVLELICIFWNYTSKSNELYFTYQKINV